MIWWTTDQLPLQVLRRLLPGVHLVLQRAHLVQLVQEMVLGRIEKHLALLSEKLHGKTFNLVLANLSRASAFKISRSHFVKRSYHKTFSQYPLSPGFSQVPLQLGKV